MGTVEIVFIMLGLLAAFLVFGTWIGFALMAVAAIAIDVFAGRPAGISMATTAWSSTSSWMLSSLPMFIWMGDILYRTRLSEDLFRGLAPLMGRLPGGLLHTNVMGCTIFGSVSGSSAATLTTVAQMTLPELKKRNYPDRMVISTLAGPATLGLMIPPSIIMVVYGVMTNESVSAISIAGIIPGFVLAGLFTLYVVAMAKYAKDYSPDEEPVTTWRQKFDASKLLLPVNVLGFVVLGAMFAGFATATEAAALGVAGALALAWWQGTLTWTNFVDSAMSAVRTTAMIGFILFASSTLSLAMGYTDIPNLLAAKVQALQLSPFWLLMALLVLYTILGHFLDGISSIVLTLAVVEPMVRMAGIDMIWFGVFIVLVVEMAQISPPVGFNLFILQAMTGYNIFRIAWWCVPMHLIMLGMVFIMIWFPELATWLPKQMIPVLPNAS